MAATLNQSSENTFLSLRARLRTPECASQHFAERVAKATLFDGPKFQEHLQLDLLKVLTAHRNPEKQQSKGSQDETYTLLEQLAKSLAAAGASVHQQSIDEIQDANEAIQSKINDLEADANETLAKSAKLYELITQPLSKAHANGQDDAVAEQTALVHDEFANAEDKLESLHEQWQACVRAENEAWKRLMEDEDEDEAPPELHMQDLVDATEGIMANGEGEIQSIEEEYAEYIQIESLKVMQTLMEG